MIYLKKFNVGEKFEIILRERVVFIPESKIDRLASIDQNDPEHIVITDNFIFSGTPPISCPLKNIYIRF